MENLKNKKYYLRRRTKQLHQWDRVIDRMKARADKAQNQSKTEILRHIINIEVKKEGIALDLRNLKKAENEIWDNIKAKIEKSWVELRHAFLNPSARTE